MDDGNSRWSEGGLMQRVSPLQDDLGLGYRWWEKNRSGSALGSSQPERSAEDTWGRQKRRTACSGRRCCVANCISRRKISDRKKQWSRGKVNILTSCLVWNFQCILFSRISVPAAFTFHLSGGEGPKNNQALAGKEWYLTMFVQFSSPKMT